MSTPTFSVIVPVYNAETTLRRCVDSVLREGDRDLELILVDDGSTDGSAGICKEYEANFEQVKYICKQNGGVSSARNVGLAAAEGEWILFLDSDDSFLEGWLASVRKAVGEYSADLIQFSRVIRSREQTERVVRSDEAVCRSKEEIAPAAVREMKALRLNVPYAKLFRKSVIDQFQLRFPETLSIGEDLIFSFSFLMRAESFTVLPECIYSVYVDNQGSLSRKRRDYLLDQLLKGDKLMTELLASAELPQKTRDVYRRALSWSYYRKAYAVGKELLKYDCSTAERLKRLREVCRRFDRGRIKNCGWKTRLMSLPVRWRIAGVIDLLVRYRVRKGQ